MNESPPQRLIRNCNFHFVSSVNIFKMRANMKRNHTITQIHTHTHLHIYLFTQLHTYIFTNLHINVQIYLFTHLHSYLFNIPTYLHSYTHTQKAIYTVTQ